MSDSGSLEALVERLGARVRELESMVEQQRRVIAEQADRIVELERHLGRDSSTSSCPPSSDAPWDKQPAKKRSSSRCRSGRKPGKQPGSASASRGLVDDPDETFEVAPDHCARCHESLDDAAETARVRRQVADVEPPPPPKVTEYQLVSRRCGGCGHVNDPTATDVPRPIDPGSDLRALPSDRAGDQRAGCPGRDPGVDRVHGRDPGTCRGPAGNRVPPAPASPVTHRRSATRRLSSEICVRSVTPTRSGNSGPRPWPTPAGSQPGRPPARAGGGDQLDPVVLTQIRNHYLGALAKGRTDNHGHRSTLAAQARRLIRRFTRYEDMILRFAVDLTVPFTNDCAERAVRPVKVQQRGSGGCWRTIQGLIDFALVHSYLDTATKWGIDKLHALRQLFTTGAWLPPALTPAE